MHIKKNLLVLAGLAGSISALTGCGPKPDPYINLDFSEDTTGAKVLFWTPFGSDMEGYLEEVIEAFTEETGIEVELDSKGSYDGLKKAIDLGASKDKIPHV